MSSPNGQGKCEKGNVARIVDRLSKQDFGTLTKSENVPLKANRAAAGVGGASSVGVGGIGVGLPLVEGISALDDASDGVSDAISVQKQQKECAIVRFSYAAQQPDELDLKEGDELAVLELAEDGWARGCILHSATNPQAKGRSGLYPTNFVSTISPTSTTQTAPVAAHPPIPFHCKNEDKQSAEHIQQPVVVGIPCQTPATKASSFHCSSATSTAPSLANGGVVQSANVLPSSLLKGVAPPTITAGTRRAMSTLIIPTTATMILEGGEASNSQIAKAEFAKVLYNYEAANSDELSLPEGTVVTVVSRHCEEEDWFIAEHEGRRGLFPDNFVRFLEHGQTQASPNAHNQPPSLPAKPSKFSGIANPSANVPLTAGVPTISSRNSVNAFVKSPTENAKGMANEMHQSMVVERTSQNVPKPLLTNSATDSLKANSSFLSANRRSVIEGLQKQLFPNGKLPPQRPPQPNVGTARQSIGTVSAETNTEPKLQKDGETSIKLLVSSSSIVKSRTNIAPSNKRPPSKVNSAATLVDALINSSSFGQLNTPSSTSTALKPSHVLQSSEELPTTAIASAPSEVTPSTVGVCPVAMSSSTTNKTTVFPTRSSSPVFQPTPILCAVSDEHHQQSHQRALSSSSPTNVVNKQSPQLSPADQPNFISRAEFDQYKEEQERKLAALQDELKELRGKMTEQQK